MITSDASYLVPSSFGRITFVESDDFAEIFSELPDTRVVAPAVDGCFCFSAVIDYYNYMSSTCEDADNFYQRIYNYMFDRGLSNF